jgi:sodium-dependent dicarboxylate transporter 2/3/5
LIFGVTAFLSMWISNTATTAMMLPLALGILTQVDSKEDRGTFVFVLLGIAYSASLGGLGTIVGSPPNAIAAKALDIAFVDWMKFGIPMMLILLPVLLGAMYLFLKPNLNRTMTLQQDETIHWTKPRVLTIIVFIVAAVSWILSKQIGAAVGIEDTDAVIAFLAAVAVVSLGLVSWKQVSDNTDWGVLMLFGGGIALSNILKVSGASLVLGETVANDAPDTFRIFDSAIPPPNSINTPQSVLSDTCFQDTSPKLTTATAASNATTASVSSIPTAAPICLDNIQLTAVIIKTAIVNTRGLVQ